MKAWAAEGGDNFDKRNVFHERNVVVESMGCRGGKNSDKRNVFVKRNVVVESMGCRGGGKIVIKGMFLIKRNVVESMGCRGGENFDKKKSGRAAQRQMCVGYVVGCRGGGKL